MTALMVLKGGSNKNTCVGWEDGRFFGNPFSAKFRTKNHGLMSLSRVCYGITAIKYLYAIKSQRLKFYLTDIISFHKYVKGNQITKYIHHIKCEDWTCSPRVYLLWIGIMTFEISVRTYNIFNLYKHDFHRLLYHWLTGVITAITEHTLIKICCTCL